MNSVNLVGRLTRDVELGYRGKEQTAVATFNLAIDRVGKDGNKTADFPRIIVFGRQAENAEKYIGKGSQVAVMGRIQTGSYEKDGKTVYTTDVVATNIEYLSKRDNSPNANSEPSKDIPAGFTSDTEDIPF